MKGIKLKAYYKPQSIGEIDKTISLVESQSQDEDMDMEHYFPKLTEQHKKPIIVKLDKQRLQQCIINIQSNALKFTNEQGEIKIFYTLYRSKKNNKPYLEIQIKDNGLGIKTEDQDKIFKLFGFIQSTNDINTRGIGLGLSITKKIVSNLGGQIGFKSEYGEGSTFFFSMEIDNELEDQHVEVLDSQLDIIPTVLSKEIIETQSEATSSSLEVGGH